MKVLMVEPHGDDALFSMFDICKACKEGSIEIDLITLASTRSSTEFCNGGYVTSEKFCEIPHSYFPDRPTKHTVVNRLYKDGVNLEEHFMKICREDHSEQYKKIEDALKNIKFDNYDFVVTNVGIIHVDHMITRDVILKYCSKDKVILCSDVPYRSKVYGKKLLDSALKFLQPRNYLEGSESMKEEKIKCLKTYYPTETLFLRWDRENLEKPCEYYTFSEKSFEFIKNLIGGKN